MGLYIFQSSLFNMGLLTHLRAKVVAGLIIGTAIASNPVWGNYNISNSYTPNFLLNVGKGAAEAFFDPSIPKFPLQPFNCAGYATLAAPMYNGGRDFSDADAWDLGKVKPNIEVWQGKAASLEDLLSQLKRQRKTLEMGDILGIRLPSSSYNAPGRRFTHTSVFIGNNKVAHLYGIAISVVSLDEFIAQSSARDAAIGFPDRTYIAAVIRAGEGAKHPSKLNQVYTLPFSVAVPELNAEVKVNSRDYSIDEKVNVPATNIDVPASNVPGIYKAGRQ